MSIPLFYTKKSHIIAKILNYLFVPLVIYYIFLSALGDFLSEFVRYLIVAIVATALINRFLIEYTHDYYKKLLHLIFVSVLWIGVKLFFSISLEDEIFLGVILILYLFYFILPYLPTVILLIKQMIKRRLETDEVTSVETEKFEKKENSDMAQKDLYEDIKKKTEVKKEIFSFAQKISAYQMVISNIYFLLLLLTSFVIITLIIYQSAIYPFSFFANLQISLLLITYAFFLLHSDTFFSEFSVLKLIVLLLLALVPLLIRAWFNVLYFSYNSICLALTALYVFPISYRIFYLTASGKFSREKKIFYFNSIVFSVIIYYFLSLTFIPIEYEILVVWFFAIMTIALGVNLFVLGRYKSKLEKKGFKVKEIKVTFSFDMYSGLVLVSIPIYLLFLDRQMVLLNLVRRNIYAFAVFMAIITAIPLIGLLSIDHPLKSEIDRFFSFSTRYNTIADINNPKYRAWKIVLLTITFLTSVILTSLFFEMFVLPDNSIGRATTFFAMLTSAGGFSFEGKNGTLILLFVLIIMIYYTYIVSLYIYPETVSDVFIFSKKSIIDPAGFINEKIFEKILREISMNTELRDARKKAETILEKIQKFIQNDDEMYNFKINVIRPWGIDNQLVVYSVLVIASIATFTSIYYSAHSTTFLAVVSLIFVILNSIYLPWKIMSVESLKELKFYSTYFTIFLSFAFGFLTLLWGFNLGFIMVDFKQILLYSLAGGLGAVFLLVDMPAKMRLESLRFQEANPIIEEIKVLSEKMRRIPESEIARYSNRIKILQGKLNVINEQYSTSLTPAEKILATILAGSLLGIIQALL